MAETPDRGTAVVLVHGACHGAWCWEEVVPLLQARGLDVRTVELPMASAEEDAAAVRAEITEAKRAARAVLLVGHSYGGMVISRAGHEADRLLYLTAIMPEPGQAVIAAEARHRTPETESAFVVADDGLTATLDPVRAVPAFFARCSPEQQRRAVARLRPIALSCLTEPADDPAWRSVPAGYVIATGDRALALDYQRERAEVLGDVAELESDHSPFFSAVPALVDLLDLTAARTSK